MSDPIPPWLHDSHSHAHLERVVLVLAKRERARDAARARSRQQSTPADSPYGRRRVGRVAAAVSNAIPGMGPDEDLVQYFAVSAGCQTDAQSCNRYLHLEPYDRTRVVVGDGDPGQLDTGAGQEERTGTAQGQRYINANWVRELTGGHWWIATQAPLPGTIHAFLSILLQPITRPPQSLHDVQGDFPTTSRVRTVVQLTRNFESGMQKAHVYFPAEVGEDFVVRPEPNHGAPALRVRLLGSDHVEDAHCVTSRVAITPLSLTGQDECAPIIFTHCLYTRWPDHGVPAVDERPGLLSFARLVDRINKDVADTALDPDPPIMVGCSAGIGRTGAFIALSSLMRAYGLLAPVSPSYAATPIPRPPPLPPSPLGPLPDDLRDDLVAQEVDALREQRPGMVQREEQILLIYEALALAFVEHHKI